MRYIRVLLVATLATPACADLYSVGSFGINARNFKLLNNAPLE